MGVERGLAGAVHPRLEEQAICSASDRVYSLRIAPGQACRVARQRGLPPFFLLSAPTASLPVVAPLPAQPASLLPLVDMSNHSFEPNAKVVPGPGGSMHMVALR